MKLEDYPHLVEMKLKITEMSKFDKDYWRERCTMLEKSIDPTYSDFERSNCRLFYKILASK